MSSYKTGMLFERLEYASCMGKKTYFSRREADDKAAVLAILQKRIFLNAQPIVPG